MLGSDKKEKKHLRNSNTIIIGDTKNLQCS